MMKRLLLSLLLLSSLVAGSSFGQQGMGPGPGLGKPPGAAGSDFVTDAFNGTTDGNDLAGRTADVGGTWTHHTHANYSGTNINFASNRVVGAATTAYYVATAPPSADYYVQADTVAVTVISQNAAVAGRMDTTADSMYICRENSGTSYDLRKIVTGTATTLATSTSSQPTAGQTVSLKLIMAGDQISCVANGVTLGPVTDTAITAAGRAGIRFAGAATSTTGFHIDNFSAR